MARTTDTTTRNPIDELRRAVSNRLKASFGAVVPVSLTLAMDRVFTAMEYMDETLRRSAFNDARAAFAELIDEAIEKELIFSRDTREGFTQVTADVGTPPSAEFDDIGRELEELLNDVYSDLIDLRDGAVRMMVAHGVELTKVEELDDEIARVEAFKAAFIGGWPWSHLPGPTPDPDSAARSRAEAEAERGELIGAIDFLAELQASEPVGR